MEPVGWAKEREQWIATLRNAQGEVSRLKVELTREKKRCDALCNDYEARLKEKDKLIQVLDKQMRDMHDEMSVLNLEITCLTQRINELESESWHTAPD